MFPFDDGSWEKPLPDAKVRQNVIVLPNLDQLTSWRLGMRKKLKRSEESWLWDPLCLHSEAERPATKQKNLAWLNQTKI